MRIVALTKDSIYHKSDVKQQYMSNKCMQEVFGQSVAAVVYVYVLKERPREDVFWVKFRSIVSLTM